AAPVFGRPEAAAAAKLFIVVAGAPDAVRICSPLFEAMGQKTLVVSNEPPAANLVKLSGNFLTASVIEALGEAMALVGKAGVDRHRYLEILTSTLFTAPMYKMYGGLIAEQRFEPAGFAAPLGHKDHPPHPRRGGDAARAHAVRERVARPVLDAARPGRRGPRLVGDRGARREGRRPRGPAQRPADEGEPKCISLTKCSPASSHVVTRARLAGSSCSLRSLSRCWRRRPRPAKSTPQRQRS